MVRSIVKAWSVLRTDGVTGVADQVTHRIRRRLRRPLSSEPYLCVPSRPDQALGMITPEERAYLQWYTAREYTGAGAIVDLGSWVGSSVTNLALGLERNERVPPGARRIHAYDRFIWERWMDEVALGTDLAGRYRPGELFVEEFRRRTARWASILTVHAGDLLLERWDHAEPVEFLFNDASKSWELVASIARTFYPALMPGRSIVVEQDYAHYYTPWVHLLRHRFRRWFEPVMHVRFSASAVFRCTAAPPTDLLETPLELSAFTEEEIRAAFAEAFRLTSPEMRANVAAAQVMLYLHAGDLERAAAEYRRLRAAGHRGRDMILVGRWLRREKV